MRARRSWCGVWWLAAAVAVLVFAAMPGRAQMGGMGVSTASAFSIPATAQMTPAALHALLQAGGKQKPMMLQVGSHVLFQEAHIPGSVYAGPGAEASGLERLESAMKGVPKNRFVVIYCGCCPWSHCPNMGPAFAKLRSLGFTHVKALYLAHNFGADWAHAGYQVASGN
ncbi:MAG TPA: hypothetical protein VMV57_08275 [Terracidiphilus sp.]|nr:hypothetical protein [Terracidiphilus sp.]